MFRRPNTNARGGSFMLATIQAVWTKATVVPGFNPATTRKDRCGAWIHFADYGKTTENGWEVDHIVPVALGSGDELNNLQPLQWQNNRHKGDSYPNWTCAVRAA